MDGILKRANGGYGTLKSDQSAQHVYPPIHTRAPLPLHPFLDKSGAHTLYNNAFASDADDDSDSDYEPFEDEENDDLGPIAIPTIKSFWIVVTKTAC